MWKKILTISALAVLISPIFCFASDVRPGTDDYLIANGWTEEQLTTNMATEGREFFASTAGEATVSDPLGDVLSRTGTHPTINYAWGDISEAKLTKDPTRQCWSVNLTVGENIPTTTNVQVNFLVYMDGDSDTSNNAPDGIRANMDKEFNLKNSENNWAVDYRWYNSAYNALTWAINKDTVSTFAFLDNKVNICIPFAEVPENITPVWRVAVAVYDGTNTQIDVAQNTGFPPIKGQADNTANQTGNSWSALLNWWSLGIVAGIAVLMGLVKVVVWVINKRRGR